MKINPLRAHKNIRKNIRKKGGRTIKKKILENFPGVSLEIVTGKSSDPRDSSFILWVYFLRGEERIRRGRVVDDLLPPGTRRRLWKIAGEIGAELEEQEERRLERIAYISDAELRRRYTRNYPVKLEREEEE